MVLLLLPAWLTRRRLHPCRQPLQQPLPPCSTCRALPAEHSEGRGECPSQAVSPRAALPSSSPRAPPLGQGRSAQAVLGGTAGAGMSAAARRPAPAQHARNYLRSLFLAAAVRRTAARPLLRHERLCSSPVRQPPLRQLGWHRSAHHLHAETVGLTPKVAWQASRQSGPAKSLAEMRDDKRKSDHLCLSLVYLQSR